MLTTFLYITCVTVTALFRMLIWWFIIYTWCFIYVCFTCQNFDKYITNNNLWFIDLAVNNILERDLYVHVASREVVDWTICWLTLIVKGGINPYYVKIRLGTGRIKLIDSLILPVPSYRLSQRHSSVPSGLNTPRAYPLKLLTWTLIF